MNLELRRDKISRARAIGEPVAAIISLAYAILVVVRWHLPLPEADVDASWVLLFHHAFTQRVDFGHDLIFSFGPWGFLYEGYTPETGRLSILIWIALAGIWWAGVWTIVRRAFGGLVGPMLVILLALVVSAAPADVFFASYPVLLLFLRFDVAEPTPVPLCRATQVIEFALLAAVALSTQIKVSLFFVACPVVALIVFQDLRARRVPHRGSAFVGFWVLFWCVARQPFGGIAPFLLHAWQISDGYAGAMSLPAPRQPFRLPLPEDYALERFLAAAALHATLLAIALFRRPIYLTGTLVFLFLTFKMGFVRHDDHVLISATAIAWSTVLFAAVLWTRFPSPMWKAALVACALTCGVLAVFTFKAYTPTQFADVLVAPIVRPVGQVARATGWLGTDLLAAAYRSRLDKAAAHNPLPDPGEPCDIYPHNSLLLYASNIAYRNRPTPMSYKAYVPGLAQGNADFLASDRAPKTILFGMDPIDGRIPAFDDGPSWPELLTRYDIVDRVGGNAFLRLTRSAQARPYRLNPIGSIDGTLGSPVIVPHFAPPQPGIVRAIWAKVELRQSLLGRVGGLLYRPTMLQLSLDVADGSRRGYRGVPGPLAAGFVLSPAVADLSDFTRFAAGELPATNDVRRFTLLPVCGPRSWWEPEFRVRFYALEFPARPSASRSSAQNGRGTPTK